MHKNPLNLLTPTGMFFRLGAALSLPAGDPESQRRGAAGAGVGSGGPFGVEAEEVLRVLPEIRFVTACGGNLKSGSVRRSFQAFGPGIFCPPHS